MRNGLKIPLQSRKVTLEINTNLKVGPEIKTNPQSEKKKKMMKSCKAAEAISSRLQSCIRNQYKSQSWTRNKDKSSKLN